MVNCLIMYLQKGLYQCSWESMHIRKFINETSPEFWHWIGEDKDGVGGLKPNECIYRVAEMESFIEEYTDWGPRKYALTSRKWAIWLNFYGTFKGWDVQSEKNQTGHYTRYTLPGEPKIDTHKDIIDDDPF